MNPNDLKLAQQLANRFRETAEFQSVLASLGTFQTNAMAEQKAAEAFEKAARLQAMIDQAEAGNTSAIDGLWTDALKRG